MRDAALAGWPALAANSKVRRRKRSPHRDFRICFEYPSMVAPFEGVAFDDTRPNPLPFRPLAQSAHFLNLRRSLVVTSEHLAS